MENKDNREVIKVHGRNHVIVNNDRTDFPPNYRNTGKALAAVLLKNESLQEYDERILKFKLKRKNELAYNKKLKKERLLKNKKLKENDKLERT